MKKFIYKIFAFLGTLSIVCMLLITLDIFVVKNQYTQNYQASIIDKINRLETIESKKIVLVGNSNLAFGIRSDMIEEAFGIPVVNLGLHGGMGDKFHENMVKGNLRDGDIVVYCSTDYYSDGCNRDNALTWITLEKHIRFWSFLDEQEKGEMLKAYPYYAYCCLTKWATFTGNKPGNDSYSRTAFNVYGDIVYKPLADKRDGERLFGSAVRTAPTLGRAYVERVNAFNEYVTAQGAELFVVANPIGYHKQKPNELSFNEFQAKLKNSLDCKFISNFTDYFYPSDYFYDTVNHLTEEGAKYRTKQLIEDLKTVIK